MKQIILQVTILLSVLTTSIYAVEGHNSPPSNVCIIAFRDGTALWREGREVVLAKGMNKLEFSEVPLTIDNPSIIIRSLTEQKNFKVVETGVSTVSKSTESNAGKGTPSTTQESLEPSAKLFASVLTPKSGRHQCELLYKVSGLKVTPRYIALLGSKGTMDLMGLASINNGCGLAINNAAIYLPVEATSPPGAITPIAPYSGRYAASNANKVIHSTLHLISTPVSVEKGQTKNLQFVTLPQVSFKKINLYDGMPMKVSHFSTRGDYDSSRRSRSYSIQKANANTIKIIYELDRSTFKTPKGGLLLADVQVYQLGTEWFTFEQGYLEFDRKRDRYKVVTGPHPGLVGSRKQLAFKETVPGQFCEEIMEVRIKNNTSNTEEVSVREYLLRSEKYKIRKSSQDYREIEPGLIEFRLVVKPDASSRMEYTVQYEY